jgi:hypothetical protein
LALKAALCRLRFAFISLLILIYSRPTKVELNPWSSFRGPPHFDLNPLAVIAARTNFLLSLGTLIRHATRIDIPVFFCDSIITPSEYSEELFTRAGYGERKVDTAKGTFSFPGSVIEKDKIEIVCTLIEESVQLKRSTEQFVEKLYYKLAGLDKESERLLTRVFEKIAILNANDENGIWARILKNQFAPVFVGKNSFDFVIGNPPWVNWESLSDSYRAKTFALWIKYGLFSLSGHAAHLGGGKKDLSMLFTYVCLDDYLKEGGRLGFIITQSVFKTEGAGDGFRRFQLGDKEHFKILQVDDLSDFQPFEGATNMTAIVSVQKGKVTKYPVEYMFWRKKKKLAIKLEDELESVLEKVQVKRWIAEPVESTSPSSPWLTARPKAIAAARKAIGQANYRAYAGACTWANGVYWMEIMGKNQAGQVIVRNLNEVGKREGIQQIEAAIEPHLLFPLLRWQGVERWRAKSETVILNVQDPKERRGYDEDWLKDTLGLTYGYLLKFETLLRQRSGFRKYFCKRVGKGAKKKLQAIAPFYSIYNVGEYTFSSFKVVWGRMGDELAAAVADTHQCASLDEKPAIPQETVMFVPFEREAEAHYLCALLNSCVAAFIAKSYSTGKSFASAHLLQHVKIPKFDAQNKQHCRLGQLSEQAHAFAAKAEPDEKNIENIETEIDKTAAELWGITAAELAEIKFSLADLQ